MSQSILRFEEGHDLGTCASNGCNQYANMALLEVLVNIEYRVYLWKTNMLTIDEMLRLNHLTPKVIYKR